METINISIINYYDTENMVDTKIPISCIPKVSENISIWNKEKKVDRYYEVLQIDKCFDIDDELSLEIYVL